MPRANDSEVGIQCHAVCLLCFLRFRLQDQDVKHVISQFHPVAGTFINLFLNDTVKRNKGQNFLIWNAVSCLFLMEISPTMAQDQDLEHIVGGVTRPCISKKFNVQESQKNMAALTL